MTPKIEWVECEIDGFIGPPKPSNCLAGMESHTWTLSIHEGHACLTTSECRLCNDGAEEIESEELEGEFLVKIKFFHETYGYEVVEHNWWWEVTPI